MALHRTCLTCGSEFTTTPSQNQRYCSRACGWTAQKGRAHPRPSIKIECVCQTCGKTFLRYPAHVRKGHGKYCSNACSSAARLGERRGGTGRRHSNSVRRRIIERDKVCMACGLWDDRPRCMQVHHLDDDINFSLSNLILLCIRCHREWHRQEGDGPAMRGRPRNAK